jgi:hypothetical protein
MFLRMLAALAAASSVALPTAAWAQSFPIVTTIAGSGAFGIPGGSTASSPFMEPIAAAIAPDGSIYVSDFAAQRIVRIAGGSVEVVAGGGGIDASGIHVPGGFANGPALSARFNGPAGLAFDGDSLLIADAKNNCVRRLKDGIVTTFAGVCGSIGSANGRGDAARFARPMGVTVVPGGAVYIADAGTGLRQIDPTGLVSTTAVPSSTAYGSAFDAPSRTLFIATKDGIFIMRDGVLATIKFGGTTANGIRSPQLSFGYGIGEPFGIVALDKYTALYTDAQTGALRYIEGYTGSAAVLSGSGSGGDYRVTGRDDGPLGPHSFVEALGLTLAPDRSIIVADGVGRVVRRIAPWSAQTLSIPADQSVPHWEPHRFRIAYIGNSTIWSGATWYDSIEARVQARLDTPEFRAAHGVPEVQPFWIVGANSFQAAADYGTFLVQNHLADAIVLQQSSMSLLNDSPPPGTCGGLNLGQPWTASQASTIRLGQAAARESVPVIGVAVPAGQDIAPAEEISWSIIFGQSQTCIAALFEQTRQFHGMLLDLFGRARIPSVDVWPAFVAAENQREVQPLFGSFDGHFTVRGRTLVADSILPTLARVIAAKPK